jgi:GH25 family lysozyme M1 (1,4-beta-N-acetylmuramidase)
VIKIENMEVNILMEILQRGIDVSTWQGDINWQQVKDSGIDFAILRSSFGSANPKQIDNKFYQNVQGCQAVGMPIGAYHY